MLIEFAFKEFLTENLGRVLKPFAEVTLQNGSHLEKVNMLIDSGADVTLIRKSRGDDLGLDTAGANGGKTSWWHCRRCARRV